MISSVKAKRFFVGCTNVNARLTSILILKKSRSWGKSKRGKGGWGDIFFSRGDVFFSPSPSFTPMLTSGIDISSLPNLP